MASQTLTDQTVASTYQGVLHAGGEALPLISTSPIYDGSGQVSSLSLGISSQGAAVAGGFSCSGQLTAGDLKYTTTDSPFGANFPLVSDGNKNVVFGKISNNAINNINPKIQGNFSDIYDVLINSRGSITNINTSTKQVAYGSIEGASKLLTYTVNNYVITCTLNNHNLQPGNIIGISTGALQGSYLVQSVLSNNVFTIANKAGIASPSSGSATLTTILRNSFNVSSVTKVSTGIYAVNFIKSFNNTDYAASVTGYAQLIPPYARPLVPYVTKNASSIIIQNGVQPEEGSFFNFDCAVDFNCVGNASASSTANINFNKYTADNWSIGLTDSSSHNAVTSITPAYMVANNYTAIVMGSSLVNEDCIGASQSLIQNSLINSNTNTSLKFTCASPNSSALAYVVVYYFNNQLYYRQFYSTTNAQDAGSTISNIYDEDNFDATSIINSGMGSTYLYTYGAGIKEYRNIYANQNGSSLLSWLTTLLSKYSNSFTAINSVDINHTVTGNGSCASNYWAAYHNTIKFTI